MTRPLIADRRFFPLWLAASLGAFNDNMLRQAIIIAIVYGAVSSAGFRDSTDAIPVIGALFSATTLACTAIAGQVAEKFDTALLLRRLKLFEAGLMALAFVGFALKSGPMLIAVYIAMSALIAFFSPVRIAAMPKYLKADELVRGNAFVSAGMFVAVVLGLVLGGVLIAQPGGGLLVGATLLATAIASVLGALAAPSAPGEAPALRIDWNPVGQSVRILSFAFAEPAVWRPLAGVAFFFVVSTMTTILVPLYALEELGADGEAATWIMGVFAVGAGAGAIAAAGLAKGRSGLGLSAIGATGAGATTMALFWMTEIVHATGRSATVGALLGHAPGTLLLAFFFCCSAFMGLYLVPLQAAAQRRAPAGKRARILAAGNLLSAGLAMLGALAALAITQTMLTPKHGLLFLSILQIGVALYMVRRWLILPRGLYDQALDAPDAVEAAAR